ncbi:MAG: phage major capsid protein [Pseudomonadota bacterium]
MLESVKIQRRQSEIRQNLSELVAKEQPSDDETRQMEELDREYRQNETRFRASLVAEDEERREASEDLETRSENEWSDLIDNFEMRQVALALDEGRQLEGQTAEIVSELRQNGGYQGLPVPWEALEVRAGETVASGTPNPMRTAPIIDRLFADSVAAQMGAQMVNVGVGEVEYPVATSDVSAGWAANETGEVPGPIAYETIDRPLKPDHNLGVQMRITRKTLKQSGSGLEQAVRRDMNGAIRVALDRAVFQGSGAGGEPTGILAGAATWGIQEEAWSTSGGMYKNFRSQVVSFMNENAANGPGAVSLLVRPEVWDKMDDVYITGTATSEWDKLVNRLGRVSMSSNALAAPTGDPATTTGILTTRTGGVAPFFVGTWGAIDLIRDPYTDAKSGALRVTALATMDVTISRAVQTRILTGIE